MAAIEFVDRSGDNLQETPEAPTEVITEPTAPVEEVKTTEQPVDNSKSKDSMKRRDYRELYEKSQKSYEELRSMNDKRFNELQKRLDVMSPYEASLKQALDEKKKAELMGLHQSDPLEVQRRIAEEAINQRFAPLQQQMQEMQVEKQASQTINHLQSTYGETAFNAMKAPMAEIIQETIQYQGEQVANILAQNPDALFNMAVGRAYLSAMQTQNQNKQIGTQNQNKAVNFAKGTSKPVTGSKPVQGYENMNDAELEKLAYEQMARMQGSR